MIYRSATRLTFSVNLLLNLHIERRITKNNRILYLSSLIKESPKKIHFLLETGEKINILLLKSFYSITLTFTNVR